MSDRPDYRPDLYDHVEGPEDSPQGLVYAALQVNCPDCRPNVFIERDETQTEPPYVGWRLKIAHDATCPELRRLEGA